MVMLSTHFDLQEFEHEVNVPAVAIPTYAYLCENVLEPVRREFGSLGITSGYRSSESNAKAHGQPNSEHIATADYCAADFYFIAMPGQARMIFDWMRNNPMLPFHQLILEHSAKGSSVIHVSYNRTKPGIRSVLEGATHNAQPYVKVDYVAYNPPSNNHTAVQDAVEAG